MSGHRPHVRPAATILGKRHITILHPRMYDCIKCHASRIEIYLKYDFLSKKLLTVLDRRRCDLSIDMKYDLLITNLGSPLTRAQDTGDKKVNIIFKHSLAE